MSKTNCFRAVCTELSVSTFARSCQMDLLEVLGEHQALEALDVGPSDVPGVLELVED